MPLPTQSAEIIDAGNLGFVEGGYLLVKAALAKAGFQKNLKIAFAAPFFAEHLEAWARPRGISCKSVSDTTAELVQNIRPPEKIAASTSVHVVAEEALPVWGIAARGAAVEPGVSFFSFPLSKKKIVWSEKAARYYRLAAARQWNPDSLDWGNPPQNSELVEDAIVQVMTYLIENETAALIVPARFIGQVHPHFREVQQFLAIQAADEARHIEVFSRRAALCRNQLGVSALSGQSSLATLVQETDFSLSALLLSVLGEGTFLTLLKYLGRYAPDQLTQKICRLAAHDEARHVAFAMAHLMPHAGDADMLVRYRNAIRRRYESLAGFSELNEDVYAALHLVFAGSSEAAALKNGYARLQRMVAEMHAGRIARLTKLGFSAGDAVELSQLHTKNFM